MLHRINDSAFGRAFIRPAVHLRVTSQCNQAYTNPSSVPLSTLTFVCCSPSVFQIIDSDFVSAGAVLYYASFGKHTVFCISYSALVSTIAPLDRGRFLSKPDFVYQLFRPCINYRPAGHGQVFVKTGFLVSAIPPVYQLLVPRT